MEKRDVLTRFVVEVGKNVEKHRKARKLSLEKLGLECGLTRMQVHRIERGYNITMETLLKLSMAMELGPADLVKFEYPEKSRKNDLEDLVNNNRANRARKTKVKKKKK